ncbi:MAG: hypothetical protein HY547_09225 [Elusimicrobia bacterium]|nr:hypothetical protein [Elusimicrobiota bacterium]
MKEQTDVCPACGHRLKAGVKVFEGFMARLFVQAARLSKDATVEWRADRADAKSELKKAYLSDVVFSKDLREAGFATRYARLGDLKYWRLLKQEPEWWHQGIYQITDLAKNFLSGIASVPKQLKVGGGKVFEESEERIYLQSALGNRWNEIADWISDWRKKRANEGGQGLLF